MNPTETVTATPGVVPGVDAAIAAAGHGPDMSMLGLFLQADWVVKAVMIALALASIICWAIIVEKSMLLGRLKREIRGLVAAAAPGAGQQALPSPQGEGLAARVLRAGTREWRDGRDEPGLPFLATTGAVAPFIGLFGTVWGIMNSFAGIAQSNDTSLAVVAPGIAEALFATAIGLIAAIPAVMAYNRLLVRLSRLRQEGQSAAADLAASRSRRPPSLAAAAASRSAAAE